MLFGRSCCEHGIHQSPANPGKPQSPDTHVDSRFPFSLDHLFCGTRMTRSRQLRYLAEYAAFRAIVLVIQCLPTFATVVLAHGLAWVIVNLLPRKVSRYDIARDNLRIAFGEHLPDSEVLRIFTAMWQHLFRMVCEMVQLPRRFELETCAEVLDFENRNACVRALCCGRPVICLGGHFGNWEISVNTFGKFGFPMGVVARDLDNPWLHEWFRRYRESTGHTLISKAGAGADVSDIMHRGGMVSMLCDQDAGRTGLFVDFFGRPASTFKSIALLALQYNALIIVGGAWRLPESQQKGARWVRFCLTTQEIIDPADYQDAQGVERLTQRFTTALEDLIRKAPEQYFWVHRRWKSVPGERKRRRPAKPASEPTTTPAAEPAPPG